MQNWLCANLKELSDLWVTKVDCSAHAVLALYDKSLLEPDSLDTLHTVCINGSRCFSNALQAATGSSSRFKLPESYKNRDIGVKRRPREGRRQGSKMG